jgi:alpha-ketoglutarate-dependent 2,4-dichlorophenoxyacetate dioxygenase
MHIEPIGTEFAARISGIDLAHPLSNEDKSAIIAAIDRYAVLVFPAQSLSSEQQVAFVRQFGELDTEVQKYFNALDTNRLKSDVVTDISNVDLAGSVAPRFDRKTLMNIANSFWHSDGSHYHYPFRHSMLFAVAVSSWGGETEFADLRAAYDTLDERTRALIAGRTGIFWSPYNRIRLGMPDPAEARGLYPPVEWPLVRTHPATGRELLWVGQPLCQISGMSVPEGRALAQDLLEHATGRDHVYSHRWAVGDLVMWDNRSVLHRGRRFDFAERRELRRVGTKDDVHSLGVLPTPAGDDLAGFPLPMIGNRAAA